MTKYKEILITHVTSLDEQLRKVVMELANTTDFEKDRIDILSQMGLIGKFNSDLGDMLMSSIPKEVIIKFVQESPEDIYQVEVLKSTSSKPAGKSVDPITELANQLENLTAVTRELIKAQS